MKYWATYLLVLVGILVGAVSLYMASLSGVMGKMGLVGGDFYQSINLNELARQLRGKDEDSECGLYHASKQIPAYLWSRGETRIHLAGQLGRERIICGIRQVQNSNVERGVYTLIKGMYYLDSQYKEMRPLVEQSKDNCSLLAQAEYESWVQGYLTATTGRIHDIVYDLYKQVERDRSGVEELCIE